MRRSAPIALLAATAVAALSLAAPAMAGGRSYETTLLGANEVGTVGAGGSGSATITVNRGQGQVCYSITVTGVAPITAGHIHEAGVAASGPVVVSLLPEGSMLSEGTATGCVDVSRTLAKEISKDPSDYYVNVHNAKFPAGALRGQL